LFGSAAALAGAAFVSTRWFNVFADSDAAGAITARQAFEMAEAGEIYLVDIRRPDEWQATGVAAPATLIDMRRDDFEAALQSIFTQMGVRPLALICARGVRSDRMNERLAKAGFTDVLDVPEGMIGSGAGPGYIEQGLPLRAPTEAELSAIKA
jgi:rhodanese-related sulfurtransferase